MVELTEARQRAKKMRELKRYQWFSDLDLAVMNHPINIEFRLLKLAGSERRTAQHYYRTGRPNMANAKLRDARVTLSKSVVMREIRKYIEGNGETFIAEAAE